VPLRNGDRIGACPGEVPRVDPTSSRTSCGISRWCSEESASGRSASSVRASCRTPAADASTYAAGSTAACSRRSDSLARCGASRRHDHPRWERSLRSSDHVAPRHRRARGRQVDRATRAGGLASRRPSSASSSPRSSRFLRSPPRLAPYSYRGRLPPRLRERRLFELLMPPKNTAINRTLQISGLRECAPCTGSRHPRPRGDGVTNRPLNPRSNWLVRPGILALRHEPSRDGGDLGRRRAPLRQHAAQASAPPLNRMLCSEDRRHCVTRLRRRSPRRLASERGSSALRGSARSGACG
jgi:hypothetical protein